MRSQLTAYFYVIAFLALLIVPVASLAQNDDMVITGWGSKTIDLSGRDVRFSSPVIANIDGVLENGNEVAVAGADARLYVYLASGELHWSADLPNHNCSEQSSSNKLIHSSAMVDDVDADGRQEVIIGYGGIGGKECDGGVIAFHGDDGSLDWNFSIKQFAKKQDYWAFLHSVVSTPAAADTNGNGKKEIVFGSFDRNVYMLNSRGKAIWYYNAADTVWSSASFVDVDGDGDLEAIIGTDISANSALVPPTEDGGYVYAFDNQSSKRVSSQADIKRMLRFRNRAKLNQSLLKKDCSKIKKKKKRKKCRKKQKKNSGGGKVKTTHYSFRDQRIIAWSTHFNQAIFSQPVVADVLPAPGEEIIVMSGCFFPQNKNNKNGKWIKILRSSDGKVLQTLNTQACSETSVAVADIDEDGQLEIVAATPGDSSIGGDGNSYLAAWNPDDPTPFWEIVPRYSGSNNVWSPRYASVAIADLDGNGSLEVVHANGRAVGIYEGKSGNPLTCYQDCDSDSLKLAAGSTVFYSTPAIGDLNGDSTLELVIGGSGGSNGRLFGWTNFEPYLSSQIGTHDSLSTPWPMFRGNPARTGR